MRKCLKDRRDAVLDAFVIYLIAQWLAPVALAFLLFILSSTLGTFAFLFVLFWVFANAIKKNASDLLISC